VTLTYRPGESWEARDITRVVDRYYQWGRARGVSIPIVWVAELTQAGRVHYHLMLWVPLGLTPPKPDKQGWWVKGMTNCKWAHRPVEYIAKYASKGPGSGEFPPGLRLHGSAGLPLAVRVIVTWKLAPGWLKAMVPVEHGVRRVSSCIERGRYGRLRKVALSGWWQDRVTCIEYKTPYVARFIPGVGIELTREPWTEAHVHLP